MVWRAGLWVVMLGIWNLGSYMPEVRFLLYGNVLLEVPRGLSMLHFIWRYSVLMDGTCFLKAWGWISSLMETTSIEGWALNLGSSSREDQEKERKWRNKQETNQESEVSQSRDWQEEPVVTAAHPIRERDSGLRSLECGPPASLEKMGNSNHMGFWRSPARKTPSYFPWSVFYYLLNSDSSSSCRTEFACHLFGKYCLRVYRALTCMV